MAAEPCPKKPIKEPFEVVKLKGQWRHSQVLLKKGELSLFCEKGGSDGHLALKRRFPFHVVAADTD